MMKRFALLILMSLSFRAMAADRAFDFLPGSTGAEKEFRSLMQSGDYRHALMTWESSQRGSNFAQTANGSATWSFLLMQNGLPVSGLENLVSTTTPAKLDKGLLKLLSVEIKNSTYAQKGWIVLRGPWSTVLDNETPVLKMTNKKFVQSAFARAQAVRPEFVNKRARIWWQIANEAPLFGDTADALRALKLLRESGQSVIGQDLISMTQGRVLYQKGDLEAALASYQEIPKSSNIWMEALEERAWTHLRQNDNDKALGDLTTAMSPVLSQLAGPETFYLANLMALRVCDYPRIFENSETFKARHRARLAELQELSTKGSNKTLSSIFERFEEKGVNLEAAGPQYNSLPRETLRDRTFVQAMETRRQLLSEIKKSADLLEDGKTLGGAGDLERLTAENRVMAERLRQQAYARVRVLAQTDLKEYRVVLNKMHIIEGEVIERLHMDDNLKGQRSKLSKVEDSGDVLVFPYSKEVWMDELDNYKASVKDCPTLKHASVD